jgi:hypothetical protein
VPGVAAGRPHLVFLHGYTTAWPKAPTWHRLLARAGDTTVTVVTPTAPSGVRRRDRFNPTGKPSWFRYTTDLSDSQPQQFDHPDPDDLDEVVFGTGARPGAVPLWQVVERAVDDAGGPQFVAVAGESQGGVVAAHLGVRWNLEHPDAHLGALSLIRTAVDPATWGGPLAQSGGVPPRFDTRVHVVLGADDVVFHPYFSMYSLGPLLGTNRVRSGHVEPPYRSPDGNVTVDVLEGVGHADHNAAVYRAAVDLLLEDWLRADR